MLMFFRLNSHMSVISLEGVEFLMAQGGVNVKYDPAHKHDQIKHIRDVCFLFSFFSI